MWQCQTIIIQLNKVRLLISWVFFFIRDILHYAMDQGAYDVVLLNKLKPPCKIREHMREQFMGACFPKSIKTRKKKGSINHSVYNIILDK